MTPLSQSLEQNGYAIVSDVLPPELLHNLHTEFAVFLDNGSGGIRNVFNFSASARTVADSNVVHRLVSNAVGKSVIAVRGILFDKTTAPGGSNWKVPYHQDLSIAVRERPSFPTPGYETWSVKEGVPHVQPPVTLLENLITVRLHLDLCDSETGALRVLPGTHRFGRLSADEIARCRRDIPETICDVPEGGALIFRPLLLHASSPSTRPGARRRVLHIEYAPSDTALPTGISWYATSAKG